MGRITFDTRKPLGESCNGKLFIFHGEFYLHLDYPKKNFLGLELSGPGGGQKSTATIDKATARHLAITLLKWAMT